MTHIRAAAAPPSVPTLPRLTLVLGGTRSGKSRHAEALIAAAAGEAVYVATAQAFDEEMTLRIARHRARRDGGEGLRWETVEEPLDLAGRLPALARPGRPVLVDCLTLWLSNHLLAGNDLEAERERLVAALGRLEGPVVLVANEVGWGIVPENALARQFRDHAGLVNQRLAAIADRVVLVAAGIPLVLKQEA